MSHPIPSRRRARAWSAALSLAVAAASLVATGGASPASATTPTAVIPVSGAPAYVAVDSTAHRAYVTSTAGKVSVIDTTSNAVVASYNLGGRPTGITLYDGSLYVTQRDSSQLTKMNPATGVVTATLSLASGSAPVGVAVDPDTGKAYLANAGSSSVGIVDTATMTSVGTISLPGSTPAAVALDTTVDRAFVTSTGNDRQVKMIDLATDTVARSIGAVDYTWGVAVDPVAHRAYVAGTANSSALRVYDTATGELVTLVPVGQPRANGVAVDHAAGQVYVSSLDAARVRIVDTATLSVVEDFPIGSGALGIGIDTSSHTGYVATGANTVAVINPVVSLPQSITFTSTAPASAPIGSTYDVSATGGGSGNPVRFSIDSSSTSGACTVDDFGDSTARVNFTGAGTCLVDADQAGGSGYLAAARVQQSVEVVKKTQAVTFTSTAPSNPVIGGSYPVAATGGGSGNPVTFTVDASSAAGACTVADNGDSTGTVSFTGVGSCVIDADQAGDSTHEAAPQVQQVLEVGKAPQAITFTSTPGAKPYPGQRYVVKATGGGSGNPVTYTIDPSSDPGTCAITARTATSATVSYEGSGDCVIAADQAGNGTYAAAGTTLQVVHVLGRPQVIAFHTKPNGRYVAGSTYTVTATGGGSRLPVLFSIDPASTPGACRVDNPTAPDGGAYSARVTVTGSGVCRIDADQAGTRYFEPADQMQQAFTVNPKPQRLTITSPKQARYPFASTYTMTVKGGGGTAPVTFSVPTSDYCEVGTATANGDGTFSTTVTFTKVGSCRVAADQAGDEAYGDAAQVYRDFPVSKAAQAITFTSTRPAPGRVGDTYQVTATGGGSGNPVTVYVDELYRDACTFVDANGAPVTTSGSAMLDAPATVKFLGGHGQCVIQARQAGSDGYNPAPGARQIIQVRAAR